MALRLCAKEFRPGLRAISTTSPLAADKFVTKFETPGVQKHTRPELNLFKQINQLVRERKWDGLQQQPVKFLFGETGKRVYSLYLNNIYNDKHHRFAQRWALGKELQALLTMVGLILGIILTIEIYDFFVPETYRYGYKYGIKQQIEERHKHGDEHHH